MFTNQRPVLLLYVTNKRSVLSDTWPVWRMSLAGSWTRMWRSSSSGRLTQLMIPTLSLVLVTGHLIWSLEVDFGVISPVGQWWISSLTAL